MKYTTIRISVPTEVDKMYLNMLTPSQRLAALVQAGRKHQGNLLKEEKGKAMEYSVDSDTATKTQLANDALYHRLFDQLEMQITEGYGNKQVDITYELERIVSISFTSNEVYRFLPVWQSDPDGVYRWPHYLVDSRMDHRLDTLFQILSDICSDHNDGPVTVKRLHVLMSGIVFGKVD